MSVIAFDFYAPDDPGTLLGTLDDTHLQVMEFRPALFELGAARFTVSRHLAEAASELLQKGNLVRVRVPTIDPDPIWGFFLQDGDFRLISHKEQGGEDLSFAGPGLLYGLSWARLDEDFFAPGQGARGDFDVPNQWTWREEPYGAILTRGMEEGQNQPGTPLSWTDIDFNRTVDSDGIDWYIVAQDFQTPIGTDVLSLMEKMAVAGDLFIVAEPTTPLVTVHAYQSFGRNLTGAFGAATVRFEKGVNILTELVRKTRQDWMTHLIVRDSDDVYSRHVLSGFSGQAKYGYLDLGSTNDPDLTEKIAEQFLQSSFHESEEYELEVLPGITPASGLYLPGPEGTTNGKFWLGDQVTVHTGTGEHDLNASSQKVVAVRFILDEAADDSVFGRNARSLHIVPELSFRATRNFSGLRPAEIGEPGFCCGPNPPITGVPASCTRLYFTVSDSSLAGSSGWTGGSTDMTTHTLATTKSGTGGGHASWDAVNQAPASFGLIQGRVTLSNAALLAAVQSGGSFHVQAMIGIRHGIGIDEGAHREYLDGCIRVWRPGTSTFIGTMLSVGTATSTFMANNDIDGTIENRSLSGAAVGVPSAVATDVLVVELGLKHDAPTTGGAGGNVRAVDTVGTDLPVGDTGSTDGDAWIDICTGSVSGDSTQPVGGTGEGTAGNPNQYAPLGHIHEHGLLSPSETHYHGTAQIEGYSAGTTDHGALTGLADNDHPQYLTEAEGDAAYAELAHTHGLEPPIADFSGAAVHREGGSLQSIPTDTHTALEYEVEDLDTDGYWTVSNPSRMTVPADGWYEFHAQFRLSGEASFNSSDGNFFNGRFRVDGLTESQNLFGDSWDRPIQALSSGGANVHGFRYLEAGQYVETICYQHSGETLTVPQADVGSEHGWSTMFVRRVRDGTGAGGESDLRWEAVTDGEDVFVWESDDLVHEWKDYS